MNTKLITVGLAAILAATAVGTPAQSKITKITSKSVGGGVEIAIHGESLKAPKAFFIKGGTSYVVEFRAKLATKQARFTVRRAGVAYYNYAQYRVSPLIARLHVKVDKGVKPKLSNEDGTWFVRINVKQVQQKRPLTPTELDRIAMEKAIAAIAKPDKPAVPPQKSATKAASKPITKLSGAITNPNVKQFETTTLDSQGFKEGSILGVSRKMVYERNGLVTTAVKPTPNVPANPSGGFAGVMVSVVFDQTDVLKILEAFAKQTGVNIISSPDVSPKDDPLLLTMSMQNVGLDFAMTTVTALAKLRYTRIGNTYVVSPVEEFASMISRITQLSNENFENRVVSIASGEAAQIREATLKAIPQDGSEGYYDIIDPTQDKFASGALIANAVPSGPATGTAPAGGTPASTAGSTPVKKRAKYVILLGESSRLDQIEAYVHDLDERIDASFSLSGTAALGTVVVPIFSGETERIKTMLSNMIESNPRSEDYTIEEAAVKELAEAEESTKMILLAGPKGELATLEMLAITFDDQLCLWAGIEKSRNPEDMKRFYEVVDLMYIEPILAAFDLKGRIRGLHVTVLPDPVTPGIEGEEDKSKADTPADDTGAQATADEAQLKRGIGHEQMRLVLRGTRQEIDEAKEYLLAVDIAPRQVAVELRVMELTKTEALTVGLDWSILTGGRLVSFRMNQGTGEPITIPGMFSMNYNYQGSDTFDILGRLDQVTTDRNLIAKPNVLITDGRSSHLFVGDTIRYVQTIQASQNGTTVTIDEVDVGVTVDMIARIGANGRIAFQLKQNFSILNGFTPVPGGGQIPQTSERTTEMAINMRDGETIALGGLILEQDRFTESGIPILKDIPFIGYFFKRTVKSKERTEIVFFLTAVVVTDENRGTAAIPEDIREKNEQTGGK